jgi:ActR/RegA family two-component response regulator
VAGAGEPGVDVTQTDNEMAIHDLRWELEDLRRVIADLALEVDQLRRRFGVHTREHGA